MGQADRRAKMSPRSLYKGLTRSKGAILAAAEDHCALRVIKSQTGKSLPTSAEAPIYGALRIRTEFAQLARSLVEGGILPGPSCDGLRVVRTGRGGLSTRRIACQFRDPGKRPRGEIASGRQELTCWTRARRSGSDRKRDIGGAQRRLKARGKRRLDFRLTMFRRQKHHSPAAIRAARVLCREARASDRFQDGAPAASFPYFSISSIDAPRGAVGRPCRPPPRIFVRGERVYHGQQNDHRRLAPGRNPGGGSAR